MGTAVYPAGLTGTSGETLSLSTTLASLGIPGLWTKQAIVYNPAEDFRMHVNPALLAVYFYDASASAGSRFINLTEAMTDRAAEGTGTTMDSATTSDRLYLCFSDIVGGFRVDMTASVNATANNMTVNYWNGSAWTDSSATDGTDTGASLAQDGDVTFTAPTDWVISQLGGPNIGVAMSITDTDAPSIRGYWLQVLWSAGLDSDTEIQDLWGLNKDTSRGYFRGGVEYEVSFDRRKVGAIECVLASGTDTLEVTWVRNIT